MVSEQYLGAIALSGGQAWCAGRMKGQCYRRFVSRQEISSRIQEAACNMTSGQRLSAALATIDTIPEQLDGVLQHKVDSLAMKIEVKLAALRGMIHNSSTSEPDCAEKAVEMLKEIPDIILSSFEDKLLAMKGIVRQRVDTMIQKLTEHELGAEQIAYQLWNIPEEVQQIAGEAVEQGVQESMKQAALHLNTALETLPEDSA